MHTHTLRIINLNLLIWFYFRRHWRTMRELSRKTVKSKNKRNKKMRVESAKEEIQFGKGIKCFDTKQNKSIV